MRSYFRSFLDKIKTIDTSENDGYIDLEVLKKLYKETLGDGALADNTFDYRIQQIMKGIPTHDLDAGIFSEPNNNGAMRYFINTNKTKLLDQIFKHNIYDTDFQLLQKHVRKLEKNFNTYPIDDLDLED
jgi:hypothetical protein